MVGLFLLFGLGGAILKSAAATARFNDMAVMGSPIQQVCRHISTTQYIRPLGKTKLGRDNKAGVLIALAGRKMEFV